MNGRAVLTVLISSIFVWIGPEQVTLSNSRNTVAHVWLRNPTAYLFSFIDETQFE